MAFEAGSVFVKLGALLDKGGFDQYDRALTGARTNAARGATAKLDADEKAALRKIAQVNAALDQVRKEKAEAKTDVEIAGSLAKIKILEAELNKLSRMKVTKELERQFTGLENVIGGGDGKKGLVGTVRGFVSELPLMAKAAVAALPAITGLGGALTALVGSLGGAGLGAGAVGVAAGGGLVVGIGSIVAVAKPAANDIKAVDQAFKSYNDTLAKFGAKDPATIKAQQQLNIVVGQHGGQAVLSLIKQTKDFGAEWKKQTTSARNDMFGILLDGMHTVQHDMGTFSGVTNKIWSSLHENIDRTFKLFRGNEFQRDITSIGDTTSKAMKPLFNGFDHLILYFGRIARFSGGELIDLVKGFDAWATHLDSASRNTDKLEGTLSDMFGHLRAWINLTESLGHLLTTVLKGGASSGDDLVTSLTHVLDKWNAFLNTPKGQQDMKTFFHDSVELTKTLFRFLSQGSGAILQIANNLMPAWIAAAKILNSTLVPILVGISKLIGEHKGLTNLVAGFIAMNVALKLVRGTMALLAVDMKALTATRLGGILGGVGGGAGGAAGSAPGLLSRGLRALGGAGGAGSRALSEAEEATLMAGGRVAGVNAAGRIATGGIMSKLPGMLGKDLTGGLGGGMAAGLLRASVWGDIGIGITKGIFTGFHKGVSTGAMEALHSITLGLTPAPKDFDKVDHQINDDIDRINQLANQAARAKKLGINVDVNFHKDQVDQGVNDVLNSLERMKKGVANSVHSARSDLQLQMKLIKSSMDVNSSQGRDAMAAAFRGAADEVKKGMDRGLISTRDGTREINRLMKQALGVYGIKGHQATLYLEGRDTLTGKPTQGSPYVGKAAGGWIGNRGERGYDEIPMNIGGQPVIVGRGEALLDGPRPAVINRHQQDPVEIGLAVSKMVGAQPYGSLDELFSGVQTPHYAAKGGRVGFASGGRTNEYGGVTPEVAALIHQLDAKGFRHGSTTSGGHAAHSYHYQGEAVDFGDATNDMQKLWNLVYPKRLQFAELFGPSYLDPKPTLMHNGVGFSDPGLQQQHDNHIHIALLSKLIGGLASVKRQILPNLKIGGPDSALKTVVQSAVGRVRGAAQTRLDAAYASQTGSPNNTTNEPGGGNLQSSYHGALDRVFPRHNLGQPGVRFSVGQVNQIMRGVGLPLPAFEQIAHGESDYEPGVIGHDPGGTLGFGLLQNTTKVNGPAFEAVVQRLGGWNQMLNPVKNAIAAKWLFDRGGLSHWYGTRYLTATARNLARAGGGFLNFAGGGFIRGGHGPRVGNPLATISRRARPKKKVARKPKKKAKPISVRPPRGHVRSQALAKPQSYGTFAGPALKGLDDLQGRVDGWEKDYSYYSSVFGQTEEQSTISLGDADAWYYSGYTKFDATKDPSTFPWQAGDEMVNTDGLMSGMYFDDQGNVVGGDKVRGVTDHVNELDKLIGIRQNILGADELMGKTSQEGLGQVTQWGKGALWQLGEWRSNLIKWVKKLRGDRQDVDEVQGESKTLGARYQAVVRQIREKYAKRRHQIETANEQQAFSKAGMTHDMQSDLNREENAALAVIKGGKGSPLLKSQRSAEIRKTFTDRRTNLSDRAREANFGERMNKKNALWLLTQGESSELFQEQSHNKEVASKRADMLKGLRGDVSRDIKNRDTVKGAIRGLLGQMGDTDPDLLSKWDSLADQFPAEDFGSDIKTPSATMANSVKGSFMQKIKDLADTLRTERDVTLQPLLDERADWLAASDKHPRNPQQSAGTGITGLAEAAAAQLASFQQSRAQLFSQYGSNFVASPLLSKGYFNDPTAQAAGMRYFGAAGGSAAASAGIDPTGAQSQFVQNNYYQTGPEDPHIHAQVSRVEFQSAFG